MKTILKWLGGLVLLSVLGAAAWIANVGFYKPYSIDLFYDRIFVRAALAMPELVTSLIPHPFGIRYFDRRLDDASVAHQQKQLTSLRHEFDTLHRYDRAKLDEGRQLSYDILDFFLKTTLDGEPWQFHDYPLNPTAGIQSELPSFLITQHPIDSAADARSYIARLDLFDVKFGQVLEGLQLREQRGLIPPKFVVDKVLVEMRAFTAQPPQQNALYTGLAEKLAKLKDLPEPERAALLASAGMAIHDIVYPAYARLIENFEHLHGQATANNGVWALPDGDAFYAWSVRQQTTSELDPDAIHEIGLREVARIETEMDAILRAQGYAEGSVGVRMAALRKEPRFAYPDSDEGRRQCLADFQKIIDEINAGLGPYFDLRPKLGVQVKAVPAFKEATAPGAYYESGSLDGSRAGVFYVNLRRVSEVEKFTMRTLAYHEAIPGHHFQVSIAQELKNQPIFRSVLGFNAYAEGWALYAERLAWELGYEKDPFDNLGRLRDEMFRAVRLVVDTGMHRTRWTREQALAYLIDKTGMAETEATSETERYLVWPGQALGYKLGMLKILELRERAKAQLGDKFDLREFHRIILGDGAMPLPVLDARVNRWLAAKKT